MNGPEDNRAEDEDGFGKNSGDWRKCLTYRRTKSL